MKNKWLSRSNMALGFVFIFLPLCISLMMYGRMVSNLQNYMEYQVTVQAAALGELAAERLSAQMDELSRIAEYYRDSSVKEEAMASSMERLLLNPSQSSCGILRLGGEALFGRELPAAEYAAVQRAFRGHAAVRYLEGEGLLFTVPVYNGDNIKYVLYEFCDEKKLFSDFGESCYDGQGQLVLIDGNQEKITAIGDNRQDESSYYFSDKVQGAIEEIREKMKTGTSAAALSSHAGGKDFLFVSEIGRGNLYVAGRVPYSVVAERISSLSLMTLLVFGLLLVLFCIGTLYMFNVSAKARESDELREAKQIAEEANKSKSRFLANMTHELRTPINVILGMDEMILREAVEEEIRERAMDIKSASQILLGLINDVLDFSKIEAGNLKSIPVEYNLIDVIRDMALLSENRARQKSLNFKMEIQPELPTCLLGDDIHIRQVMINLLTNAVKYTEKGSVTLKITGEKEADEKIVLRFLVRDTGIGIKEEDLKKLFIPYSRIEEERHREIEGTGLGMSIIINLLRLLGSELHVRSVYGEGSDFWFELEQKIVDDEPIGDIQKRLDNMAKNYKYQASFTAPEAHILMVDDNALNRRLFVSLLKNTKIQITTVSSGKKALEVVQEEHFDLIFMDYLMPEMDGAQTLQNMRKLEDNLCKDTPIIVLTANAYSGSREAYLEMGFDDFLAKPIVTEKLEAMILEKLSAEYIETAAEPADRPKETDMPEKGSMELPDIEGIDWQHARLFVKDTEILLSSLQDFYENIDKTYQEISTLTEGISTEEGLADYRICVHALKSNAALLGILMISELSRLLEYAARDGEREKVYTVTPVLLEELQKIKENMRPYMEKIPEEPKEKPVADSAKLLECLEMLRFSIDQMDISGADLCMKQIRSFSYPPELQKLVDRIGQKADTLDYKGAAEEIEVAKRGLSMLELSLAN